MGEDFLRVNERVPADVLVVEAWIGRSAMTAAAEEYKRGGYRWLVTTAVRETEGLGYFNYDFAEAAVAVLTEAGVPRDQIIPLSIPRLARNRTYTALAAVAPELEKRSLRPHGIMLFTVGPHARRSRLVLQEIFPQTPIGAVGWLRVDPDEKHWWRSTERARDLMNETALYFVQKARSLWPE